MSNENRNVIITLCSYLCVGDGVKPYTTKEWGVISSLLLEKDKQPTDLINFTDEEFNKILGFSSEDISRIKRLFARTASLTFEINRLNDKGIYIITRADKLYPKILKKKLKSKCPPLFYYAGNLDLLSNNIVGFVGSRNVSDEDVIFTKLAVDKYIQDGYTIVSGGAKGIDKTSSEYAISKNAKAIEFLSDSLYKRIKDINVIKAIKSGNMLVMSSTIPTAGFDVGVAMQRNKYIYCASQQTIVVKCDYKKGGTWAGAFEALKNEYSEVFCWCDNDYIGNKKLIELGANKIDNSFNLIYNSKNNQTNSISNENSKYVQKSLFDIDD